MLRAYKKIDHKIFEVQDLVKFLVEEVFSKADRQRCKTKLKCNAVLLKLYENDKSDWFQKQVDEIYSKCKELTTDEKNFFYAIFNRNNQIEHLCKNPSERLEISLLSPKISNLVVDFFKELYDRILRWKDIEKEYGSKKDYYDALIHENSYTFCPCCGFGNIQTIYDKGHSAYDHYLPIKHYPFSVINFDNLFPLCNDCNSGAKSSKDILEKNKKVFYPFDSAHPQISFNVKLDSKKLVKFLYKVKLEDKINDSDLQLLTICDDTYIEEIETWNETFEINQRFFAQIATYAVPWMDDLREKQRRTNKTLLECFDEIIVDDSNKHLGFLKSPYLTALKKYDSFIEAYEESKASTIIRK